MESLLQTFRSMGQARLLALLAIGVVFAVFFTTVSLKLSSPGMSLLYSGLSLEDSGRITQELDTLNLKYELKAGGTQIMAPADQVLKLRLTLAQQGLPSGGSVVGYEIFDKTEALGTSNFVLNINMLRALEGELARTISSFSRVESARVHLVIPKRELFTKDKQEPSASVALKLNGEMEKDDIRAISNLVASAVPGLKPSNVTIVDSMGKLLARGNAEGDESMQSSDAQEYRIGYENRMRQMLEALLEKTLGDNKAKVQVHADLDFDRIVTNSEIYDPDGQVARSVQSNTETESSNEPGATANVSVANNLPAASAAGSGTGGAARSVEKANETTNYEISKKVENHVKEIGTIKRLSVAVLVDGLYTKNDKDEDVYAPRPAEELEQIRQLVRSAAGYDEKRGDTVEVVNMKFAPPEETMEGSSFAWLWTNLSGIIQSLVVGVVGILFILLVIRPVVNRLVLSVPIAANQGGTMMMHGMAMHGGGGMAMPAGMMPQGAMPATPGAAPVEAPPEEEESLINLDRVRGRVSSSAVRKINELIDTQPEETLSVLRQWANKE